VFLTGYGLGGVTGQFFAKHVRPCGRGRGRRSTSSPCAARTTARCMSSVGASTSLTAVPSWSRHHDDLQPALRPV